jgi:hypothetical protein
MFIINISFLKAYVVVECLTQMIKATSDLRGFWPRKVNTLRRSPGPIFYLYSSGFLESKINNQ